MENMAIADDKPDWLKRMEEARTAFQSIPEERAISAMSVVVSYVAIVGDVQLSKRRDEFTFSFSRTASDGKGTKFWEEVPQNAYAIRDEFQKIKTPSQALDFLSKSGQFSSLHNSLTWSEFQRWQRFAYLVQEHSQLACAMNDPERSGECAEALKALSGMYESSFFDVPALPESPSETASRMKCEEQVARDPELQQSLKASKRKRILSQRELYSWFRQPAGKACSIQWIPKNEQPDDEELIRKLHAGGAMIEYLVPRDRLRPVFLIRPTTTMEAIAAAIYADRCNGVEYRACDHCSQLFRIGTHKSKKYCDQSRCKNTAHQRRRRANAEARRQTVSGKTRQSKKKERGGQL